MKSLLHVLWMSLLSFQLFAETAQSAGNNAKISQLMKLSGIEEMLDSMPQQLQAAFQQRKLTAKDPAAEQQAWLLMSNAWQAEEIEQSIAAHIEKNLSTAEIDALIKFKQKPIIGKITEAESAANAVTFQADLMAYMATLQSNPPAEKTKKTISRFLESTQMVELMLNMSNSVSKAMTSTFAKAFGGDAQAALSIVDEQMASLRPMLEEQMRQQATMVSYYIYRDISDEELNQYADFYLTKLGKKELKVVSESLELAMSDWSKKSAQAIVEHNKHQ